jgi:tetratricopeptide (TPR) repeat protein
MLHDAAERLFKEGRYDAALELYAAAVNEGEDRRAVYAGMALCYHKKREHEKASACFEEAGIRFITAHQAEYVQSAISCGRAREAFAILPSDEHLELAARAESWLSKYGIKGGKNFRYGLHEASAELRKELLAALREEPEGQVQACVGTAGQLIARFGFDGFAVYTLAKGKNNAGSTLELLEAGIYDDRLTEIFDFLDGLGMIEDLPELDELLTRRYTKSYTEAEKKFWDDTHANNEKRYIERLRGTFGDDWPRVYDCTLTWCMPAAIPGRLGIEKSKVMEILKYLEEGNEITYDYHGGIINLRRFFVQKPMAERLFRKFGTNGIKVYYLIDGDRTLDWIKKCDGIPNAERIVNFMVRWNIAVVDTLNGKQTPFIPDNLRSDPHAAFICSDKEDDNPHFKAAVRYHMLGWLPKAIEEYNLALSANPKAQCITSTGARCGTPNAGGCMGRMRIIRKPSEISQRPWNWTPIISRHFTTSPYAMRTWKNTASRQRRCPVRLP